MVEGWEEDEAYLGKRRRGQGNDKSEIRLSEKEKEKREGDDILWMADR